MWFDSSSDQEESLLELGRSRKRLRDASNPLEMNTAAFTNNFKLPKEAFVDLPFSTDELLKQSPRTKFLSNVLKLATVLRFCAQGSYKLSIGNDNALAQPTVSAVLSEVLDVLGDTDFVPLWKPTFPAVALYYDL